MQVTQDAPQTLPPQLTSFIGRTSEIEAVSQLLAAARLVTLTGAGGCGKTRLAIEVARSPAIARAYADGVWFADLAPLNDSTLLAQTVAAVFQLRESGPSSALDLLAIHLQSKQLLLVLDNCEHLIGACAQLVAALLQAAPQLRVLATSREALRVAGEHDWPVPPLSLPLLVNAEESTMLLAHSDAMRLFVERASSTVPAFRFGAHNADALALICRRLDGMPLAIELAAARVNVLSVAQIAARLDNACALLTLGSRAAAIPRHQTLRVAIEWSYQLLTPSERTLLQRLSIFIGSFTLEAAEEICAGDGLARDDILGLLSELVERSLVVAETVQHTEARYRLLETIRQYSAEHLLVSGEAERLEQRHTQYFLSFVAQLEPRLTSGERSAWMQQLAQQLDNLRAVLRRSLRRNQIETVLWLAAALEWFWLFGGSVSEGSEWLERALAKAEGLQQTRQYAWALCIAGALAWVQGSLQRAHELLAEAVALWRAYGDQRELAWALGMYGMVLNSQGEPTPAARFEEESVSRIVQTNDVWGHAWLVNNLGWTYLGQGDFAKAQAQFEQALTLWDQLGDRWGVGVSHSNLGLAALQQGDLARGRAHLEAALTIHRPLGDRFVLGALLKELGQLARLQGDYARAEMICAESLTFNRANGQRSDVAYARCTLGYALRHLGKYQQAWSHLQEGLRSFTALGEQLGIATSLASMAGLLVAQGELQNAAQLFGACEALLERAELVLGPADRADYERDRAALRAQLDAERCAALWAAGRALSVPQAAQLALHARDSLAASTHAPLRVWAFGRAQVMRGEHALSSADWKYSKAKELFFFLLTHVDSTKEQIGLALWPDASRAQLRNNFRVTMHALRRALGDAQWVVYDEERYSFNRARGYWFDVELFVTNARRLLAQDRGADPTALQQTAALYRGDFLEEFGDSEWCYLRREELRQLHLDALLLLGRLQFEAQQYAQAVDTFRQVVARDSFLEVAHRELMRAHARQGERAQALQHYRALVALMSAELGVPPAPETTQLYERLRRGEIA